MIISAHSKDLVWGQSKKPNHLLCTSFLYDSTWDFVGDHWDRNRIQHLLNVKRIISEHRKKADATTGFFLKKVPLNLHGVFKMYGPKQEIVRWIHNICSNKYYYNNILSGFKVFFYRFDVLLLWSCIASLLTRSVPLVV